MNKYKIPIIILVISGLGILTWSIIGLFYKPNNNLPIKNDGNFQKFVDAEITDKCQTPEGYTDEQWAEHMSHHPDRYKECFDISKNIGTTYQNITSEDLKQIMQSKDFTLIDVHIPQQFHIVGTDKFIPYNTIDQRLTDLPSDKNAKIILYCRSGSMSKIAAQTLADLGYNNVYDLQGGLNAWKEAGYSIGSNSLQ